MSVKIDFFQGMSGDYYVNPNQSFTREEAVFITKAINEAIKKRKQKNDSAPTCPVCGGGVFVGQSKVIDGDTHYHANCYDKRK